MRKQTERMGIQSKAAQPLSGWTANWSAWLQTVLVPALSTLLHSTEIIRRTREQGECLVKVASKRDASWPEPTYTHTRCKTERK